ncbi:iron ABC transporter permease [Motilimonas cestriensis]|uniref:Iron ABC transporter permease n=1 Tax=Motilimonas cestriensis TaxID=2742685 RepID=A0ABS8WA44_9GAMM|nr:iron ABC transporter permease [Motilimonas cestriensis]MCE2595889.1 iron ABC transporter permease [Motilimonas cestriensis]
MQIGIVQMPMPMSWQLATNTDAGARVLIAPQDLPVGIITAMLGGSFFI